MQRGVSQTNCKCGNVTSLDMRILSLEKSLRSETDKNLFFFFKHDGHLDFEKKIAAGNILKTRQIDKYVLKEEKQKIVKSLEDKLKKTPLTNDLVAKEQKKLMRKFGFNVLALLLPFLGHYIYQNIINGNNPVEWSKYLIGLTAIILLTVYSKLNFNRKVNKAVLQAMQDREQQKLRLKIIQREWDF